MSKKASEIISRPLLLARQDQQLSKSLHASFTAADLVWSKASVIPDHASRALSRAGYLSPISKPVLCFFPPVIIDNPMTT